MKKILYIDLDGVVADFDRAIEEIISQKEYFIEEREGLVDEIVKDYPDIFLHLIPIKGAIRSVKKLFNMYEVYFLSTPMWNCVDSFTHKRIWVERYFGDKAKKRLILTHRKDLVIGDILVDDRLKNGADNFKGQHIHFGTEDYPNWEVVFEYLNSKA